MKKSGTGRLLAAAPFFLPASALLGVFVVWPLLRALAWSMTSADLLAPGEARFSGASNYGDLLVDPRFRQAFANTALFALLVVPAQTSLALAAALLVNRPERWWRALRVVFLSSLVMSMPVLSIVWTMIYQPASGGEMGLFNAALSALGIEPRAWLSSPDLALPAIALMSIWQGLGLQMLVFVAGLQSIDRELVDAAKVDGAGAFARFRHVILPGLKGSIAFNVVVTTILALRLFVQPYLMTRGGPEDRTLSVIQWIYEASFIQHDLGRASAAAMIFVAAVGVLALFQHRVSRVERS